MAREFRRPFVAAWRRLRRDAAGASAVEFAIIVPFLGALLTGTVDLAQFANDGLILDAAVRAGATYAIGATNCDPISTNCETPIVSVVQGYAGSLGSSVAVTFPNSTSGNSNDPRFCTWDNATTPLACTSTCNSDGSTTECPMHTYITIQAVWTVPSPIMPLMILPSSLTRSLTVRVG